jgi:phasin protein
LIGEIAPADAPPIGAAAPVDPPSSERALADAPSIGAVTPADNCPVSIQTISNAYRDYTKKSLQETGSFVEKLMAVRSFDKAIEVQTEFARQAYANFVAESQKICELYSELAKQIIFRPWEGFAAKVTQTGR